MPNNISDKYTQKVLKILESAKGQVVDAVAEIYFFMLEEKNPAEALQFFLENADGTETDQTLAIPVHFSNEEIEYLQSKCKQLVSGIITNLTCQRLGIEEFYEKLWNVIQNNALLESDKEKIYAVYCLWLDNRLPYFQIDKGMRMSNEEFQALSSKLEKKIKRTFYILNAPLKQKTERASLIISLLGECDTEEEKAVILAQALAYVEKKTAVSVLANFKGDGMKEE